MSYEELEKRHWYQEGIDGLVELAAERWMAIMCAEEDPKRCHRHWLIAHTSLSGAVEVQHIRGDGTLEEAKREPKQLPPVWARRPC